MLSSCGHWRAQHAPLAAPPLPALHSRACLWLRRPLRQPLSWRHAQQPQSVRVPAAASAAQCELPAQLWRSSLNTPAQRCPRWSCAGGVHRPAPRRGEWRMLRHRRLQHGTVCSCGGDSARQAAGEHGAAGSSGASAPEGEVGCCSTELSSCRSPTPHQRHAENVLACATAHWAECRAGGARASALGPRQGRAGALPCSVPGHSFLVLERSAAVATCQVQASGQVHR